jgi:mRNA interferase RelE/StbE
LPNTAADLVAVHADEPYTLHVGRSAARAIAEELPESVAAAVVTLVTGDLLAAPRRVGKQLHRELVDSWSARRGAYRVVYEIDEGAHVVSVVAVEHRRDVYRQR